MILLAVRVHHNFTSVFTQNIDFFFKKACSLEPWEATSDAGGAGEGVKEAESMSGNSCSFSLLYENCFDNGFIVK